MRVVVVVVVALSLLAGCSGVGQADINEKQWARPLESPVLTKGTTVRFWHYKHISPPMGESHVVDRHGRFVDTMSGLRRVLRPIDTEDKALAYRRLLADVELKRDDALAALERSTPLEFHDGERAFYGVYIAANAEKWNVGREPVVEDTGEAFVITQPTFRRGEDWSSGDVELTRETIHRDGRYEREVLRVLETGKPAMVHQPAPLI